MFPCEDAGRPSSNLLLLLSSVELDMATLKSLSEIDPGGAGFLPGTREAAVHTSLVEDGRRQLSTMPGTE